LWLYAEWRVQFDQKGQLLKAEKDQPVRLAKLDSRFAADAEAIAKAEAARAVANDAARAHLASLQVAKIGIVSNGGQEVDLPSLLAGGKITIVDFYAEWCGPCRHMSPQLEQLAKQNPDVVLLKIDIVNWNTPVTRQFGIRSIPDVRVFDRTKTQVGDATHDANLVVKLLKQANGS